MQVGPEGMDGMNNGQGPFGSGFSAGGFSFRGGMGAEDVFNQFFGGGMGDIFEQARRQQIRQGQDLSMQAQ